MPDVVVITGGTRGIGLATARRLAVRHDLVLAFRNDTAAAAAAAQELDGSARIALVQADIGTEAGVLATFAAADQLGRLVGLVNCAGIVETQARFESIDRARWGRVLAVNVLGTARCCQEGVSRMAATGGGAIVNLSSRAVVLGSPNEYVDYASSKAAVDTLTRGLALEVANLGIRVNAVRPGIIDTDIHASGGDPDRAARLGPHLPMGRAGRADEVAAAIEWLLSDTSSYVTGVTLDVSGGR